MTISLLGFERVCDVMTIIVKKLPIKIMKIKPSALFLYEKRGTRYVKSSSELFIWEVATPSVGLE